jgi:hypothetical protein
VANKWAWSLLAVNGVPGGPGGEQPTTVGTPHMILGVGLEQPLPCAALVSPVV